jgi:hypothetical protein
MAPTFDPKDFAHQPIIDNPFFPLEPGTTFIYDSPTRHLQRHSQSHESNQDD